MSFFRRNAAPKTETFEAVEEYGRLAAIWVLSCNDENPAMSYLGIMHRVGLPNRAAAEALVHARPELFRKRLPAPRLEAWKTEMMQNKRLPRWLREKEEKERKEIIAALTPEDFFRNQFRTAPDAPVTSVELLDWGLEHIDRLRKAAVDAADEHFKRVQTFVIPMLSTAVAVAAVASGCWQQQQQAAAGVQLKKYELSYGPRQQAYREFMQAATMASSSATAQNRPGVADASRNMEVAFYGLEPFLSEQERSTVWNEFAVLSIDCLKLADSPDGATEVELKKRIVAERMNLRQQLTAALFARSEV
ncbi:MAG TPA: hypothetical protein VFE05_22050 [Longimicrobiaceae bacterium]|jgi:hypothetical protein|nr:hypothetical protein [Longimicrobiaceae bacterium]